MDVLLFYNWAAISKTAYVFTFPSSKAHLVGDESTENWGAATIICTLYGIDLERMYRNDRNVWKAKMTGTTRKLERPES